MDWPALYQDMRVFPVLLYEYLVGDVRLFCALTNFEFLLECINTVGERVRKLG